MHISRRRIGLDTPVYIVAEAGVNHNGNCETALELVRAAKHVGADAVKFQIFTPSEMTARGAPSAAYQQAFGGADQLAMLERLSLNDVAFAQIADCCREESIDFIATPFSLTDLRRLLAWRPAAVKLASTDLTNVPLLVAACRSTLPLIVSTGASQEQEVGAAVATIRDQGAWGRVVLLHCVSCYPTDDSRANIRRIAALARRFGVLTGFSDHTRGIESGPLATAAGASIIEKHLTLDRSMPGPDHAMSLDPQLMAQYVESVRRAEGICGDGRIDFQPCEQEVRDKARKSIVSRDRIPAGERIRSDMLAIKRPAGGLHPSACDAIIGRTAVMDIPADTQLTWDLVR